MPKGKPLVSSTFFYWKPNQRWDSCHAKKILKIFLSIVYLGIVLSLVVVTEISTYAGTLYGVGNGLLAIDPMTGNTTLVSSLSPNLIPQGVLAFDTINHRYFFIGDNHLFVIDTQTGVVIASPSFSGVSGLEYDSSSDYSIPTPPGSDVTVGLPNGGSITYGNVDSACNTTFTEISNPTQQHNPLTNFNFIRYGYFNISTDCNYTGPVTVVYPYDESEIRGQEQNLKLFHWKGNGWEDCTVSVDTVLNTITGQVDTLSPFGIGYYYSGGGGGGYSTGANENMIAVIAILAISAGLFILRRNRWIKV